MNENMFLLNDPIFLTLFSFRSQIKCQNNNEDPDQTASLEAV